MNFSIKLQHMYVSLWERHNPPVYWKRCDQSCSAIFWLRGYRSVRTGKNALEWEEGRASIAHAEKVRGLLTRLKPEYETLKPRYSFTDKSGRTRPFTNWCNTPIARQAAECGAHIKRLYSLVYSQLSSYVHGSAWSLRRQISYSKNTMIKMSCWATSQLLFARLRLFGRNGPNSATSNLDALWLIISRLYRASWIASI